MQEPGLAKRIMEVLDEYPHMTRHEQAALAGTSIRYINMGRRIKRYGNEGAYRIAVDEIMPLKTISELVAEPEKVTLSMRAMEVVLDHHYLTATEQAEMSGCNITYIHKARKLRDGEVIRKVLFGEEHILWG